MKDLVNDPSSICWGDILALEGGEEKAVQAMIYGLCSDGAHHKQEAIKRAIEYLSYDIDNIRARLASNDYGFE